MAILAGIRLIFAVIACTIALLLPYCARNYWFQLLSFWIHLPFKAFGMLSRWMLKQLEVQNPYE